MAGSIRILVVDDESRTAELVSSRLRTGSDQFEVAVRTDPTAVPAFLAEDDVDCVVSDYRMPGIDGIELLERVRERWPDLPFVLFTGRGTESVASEAIAAGATDYVPKEVDPDSIAVLSNRIENAVESYRVAKRADRLRRRYATLLEGSRGLITVLDTEGVVQYQSPSVERVLGLARSTVEGSDVLEHVHREDREAVAEALNSLVEGRESAPSFEFRLQDGTGEWRWLGAVGADATDSPVEGYVFNAIDVTERKRQQAELERKNRAMDEASVGITITDPGCPDNPMVYANEGFSQVTGYDTETAIGRNWRFLQGEATDEDAIAQIRAAVDAGEECTVELRNYRADGTEFWNRLRITPIRDDDGTVTNFVGLHQDVSERKRYERTLSALHEVSRELLAAEDASEIAGIASQAASELLEVDAAAVCLYDEAENALLPAGKAQGTRELVGEVPAFGPGEGIAWDVFIEGEPRVHEDVSESPDSCNAETPVGAELLLPLGDHGVFMFGREEADPFDDSIVELADVLGANVEAALDRTKRERRLRKRERELDRRNERLRKLDEVNELVRTICHEIVGASDPEGVYETVCATLAKVDGVRLVCLGTTDPSGQRVVFEERAGVDSGYIESIDHGIDAEEPTARALRNGEAVVVDQVAADLRAGEWRRPALTRDYRSVVSLPVEESGVRYGSLTIYADDTGAFGDETLSVLKSLVRTVGAALRTVDRREANLGDDPVRLSFSMNGSGSPLVSLGRRPDADTDIEGVVTGSDRVRAFGTASTGPETVRDTVLETPGVASVRVLRSGDSTASFEVALEDTPVLDAVLDHGGSFERLSVADGSAQLEVSFGDPSDVNRFVELFCRRFPGSELQARRTVERSAAAGTADGLTDRQREALETAYHSGYYDWPREVDSETVAESMGITKPTFLEHLRRAEAEIVAHHLDGEDASFDGLGH
jgi:PAS domain S-box-containing protein